LEGVARAALAQQLWQQKRKGPEFVVSSAPQSTQSGSRDDAGGEDSAIQRDMDGVAMTTQSVLDGAAGAASMTTQSVLDGAAGAESMTTQSVLDSAAGAASMMTQSGSWEGEASAAWTESQTGPVDEAPKGQVIQRPRAGRESVGATPPPVSPRTPMRASEEGELIERQQSALSPEAEQLLELIKGGRTWNAATLCDETGIAVPRLIKALTDLEFSRRVYRDPMGFYEAAPNDPFREAS
jgi:hypothetical protein